MFQNQYFKTGMWALLIFLFSMAVVSMFLSAVGIEDSNAKAIKLLNVQQAEVEARIMEVKPYVQELEELRKERTKIEEQINKIINEGIDVPNVSQGNFIPTKEGGIDEFLKVNGAEFVKEAGDLFRSAGDLYGVKPEVFVCIAQADSSLGNALKSTNNIGNVGNRDNGSVVHYKTLGQAIAAMGQVLNNQYLGSYITIGQLSRGGGNKDGKVYATSSYNWNKNLKLCLRSILKDDTISEDFNFRTN